VDILVKINSPVHIEAMKVHYICEMVLLQGTLPRDYLEVTEHHLSELMFSNALQMVSHYNKKRQMTEATSLSWIYREFSVLNRSEETKLTDQIRSHIRAKRYTESVSTSFVIFIL
jgi:hypothetical protein